MKTVTLKTTLAVFALVVSGAAFADFGVGFKAGTLGLGLEGRWDPLPALDVRLGFNTYDFDATGSEAGINYDAVFAMETIYLTGNFRFPLSPFRVTAGVFSNGNEVQLASQDTGGASFDIGGTTYTAAEVGQLQSTTSFEDIAPYAGVGYDFEVFGKVGLNLDIGLLWQGEGSVQIQADGLAADQPAFQMALELERLEIENEISDYKAWPVLSLGFVYNF